MILILTSCLGGHMPGESGFVISRGCNCVCPQRVRCFAGSRTSITLFLPHIISFYVYPLHPPPSPSPSSSSSTSPLDHHAYNHQLICQFTFNHLIFIYFIIFIFNHHVHKLSRRFLRYNCKES